METIELYVLPVLAGLMLAAATGFRMFLPLAVISWAAVFDLVPMHESLSWLDSYAAAATFTVAVLIEFLADKIPVVDHAVDSVATFVKPAAAALGMFALLTEFDPVYAIVLGIVAGSTTAFGIHAAKSGGRFAANAGTFGFAAPVLSLLEDVLAVVLVLFAVFLPVMALLLFAGIVWVVVRRKRTPGVEPQSAP